MDINFKKILSRDNMYPPSEIFKEISKEDIYASWDEYLAENINQKLGLYVHIPFCKTKCTFCHCNSFVSSENNINAYLHNLKREILYFAGLFDKTKFSNIYFGGGTPSILSAVQLDEFLGFIFNTLHFNERVPFCFEAMPETLSEEKIDILEKYGVNRISLGIQTLDNQVLMNINRIQNKENLINVVTYLKNKIKYINLDLVCGLEGETLKTFKDGLDFVIGLNPDIIHIYRFNPSENTLFSFSGKIYRQIDKDVREEMFQYAIKTILETGRIKLKNDDYGYIPDSRNISIIERIENASSNFGIGHTARSNIFGKLSYINSGVTSELFTQVENKNTYMGFKHDLGEEKNRFILQNLIEGLDFSVYKKIFNSDFLKDYGNKIIFLLDKYGKDSILHNRLEIRINTNRIQNYVVNSVFYSSDILKKVKNEIGSK